MSDTNTLLKIIAGVVFAVAVILFAASFFVSWKNGQNLADKILIPFSGFIGTGKSLTRRDGTPQITCPTDKKVNILGAFYQVYDPYGECNDPKIGASKAFQTSCANQQRYPNTCALQPGCGGNGSDYRPCQCSNIDKTKGYTNCVCNAGNLTSLCKPRDVSAMLGHLCDGQNSCNVPLDTTNMSALYSTLGPLPCDILPTDANYSKLPFLPGNPGVSPGSGTWRSSASSVDPTTNQGYYVHGVYACV
jgi:hypothetical protein